MNAEKYHPLLVSLHWLMALLILLSLGMGMFSLKEIPNSSPDKLFALRGHMIVGVLLLVLVVMRIIVRFATPRPAAATTGNRLLDKLAVVTHYTLYLLVLLMALSGIAISLQAGLPDIVFFGSGTPLPASFQELKPRIAHGIIAKLLLALVALHMLAALYHQFIRKDGLIARMWFGRG